MVYVCFLCDAVVAGGDVDYKLHLVTRHPPTYQDDGDGDDSQRMGCRDCNYSTADYKQFVKHYARQHPDSLKLYECQECDFTTHFSHR